MTGPLTPEERAELGQLSERDKLEQLRERAEERARKNVGRVFAQELRAKILATRNKRLVEGGARRDDLVRAWKQDVNGDPPPADSPVCPDCPHERGTVPSVAHRLGYSESTLHRHRRRLWPNGEAPWPPTLE